MKKNGRQKDYINLIDSIDQVDGWTVRKVSSNHFQILAPSKEVSPYHASCTPSDYRSAKNLQSWLRRNGWSN